jgi:drug/metabolite transporter (DMT)-like permease
MTFTAINLLLLSVVVHAGWNAISRGRRPTAAFMLVASATGMVLLAPIALWHAPELCGVAPVFWVWLGGTSLFMALYYVALAGAYRAGEMSLVYPLARALPALLVPLVSVVLGRANGLTWWLGLAGGLIVAGALLLPMRHFRDFRAAHYGSRAFILAMLTAVGTTGYTVFDYYCMGLVQHPGGPLGPVAAPLSYIALQGLCTCVWLLLYVLFSRLERDALQGVLRGLWRPAALTGLGIYLAYTLVLSAYTHVNDPSYVAAFRQLSIPVGVVLGLTLLGERRTGPKLVGTITIFAGVVIASLS